MKKMLLLILSTILLFSFSIAFAADLKIGVLDVQKTLRSIPQVKKMQAQLKRRFTPQQTQITALQKQLKADWHGSQYVCRKPRSVHPALGGLVDN